MLTTKDLTGQTFNSWHVIKFSHKNKSNKAHWLCRCACEVEKIVESYNLTSGRSKSCRRCSALVVADNNHASHRLSDSREYKAWQAMKTRCLNPKAIKSYKYHGALGVTIHPDWIEDFLEFLAEIGPAPTDLHTVDRIDSFGNYVPGNVKWSTQTEQTRNARRSAKYR